MLFDISKICANNSTMKLTQKNLKHLSCKDFRQKNKHYSFNTNGIKIVVLIWCG